ncbi:hypothetical protein [Halothece sp. PCC 7418]|uniref:hypothetical protein n=1 Tax=Halothece sp. (strain PCC 7418) TaxID=65093 RepID=UPI0005A28981|nr:hypothetical protein [Halothece sp. PCC 7418]
MFPLTSVITLSLPAQSISLSETNYSLELDNFSHQPDRVAVEVEATVSALSYVGFIETIASSEATFMSESSLIFSQSSSDIRLAGEGSRYFGKAEVRTQAMGQFSIAAEEEFSFDYKGSFNTKALFNFPDIEESRTTVNISLLLSNETHEKEIYNLNFSSHSSQNAEIAFGGQFQEYFEEDTQFNLSAKTEIQSCLQSFQEDQICDSFPQINTSTGVPFNASETLGLVFALSFFIVRLIKKHIV